MQLCMEVIIVQLGMGVNAQGSAYKMHLKFLYNIHCKIAKIVEKIDKNSRLPLNLMEKYVSSA